MCCSFEDEGSDRGRFTSPARSVNRSISTGRAASFAADRPGSTSRSGPGAGLSAYTGTLSTTVYVCLEAIDFDKV